MCDCRELMMRFSDDEIIKYEWAIVWMIRYMRSMR